jgi:hypothetical protein
MAVVRATYIRRGNDPQRAAKKVRRAVKYYAERDGPDRAARQWYAADGRSGALEEFRTEMAALAQHHPYTYCLVLSTKAADIGPMGYKAVLDTRFTQYFFVEHHNTAFPHAHALGYTARRLTKAELTNLRGRVMEREQTQVQACEQGVAQDRQRRQARVRAHEVG